MEQLQVLSFQTVVLENERVHSHNIQESRSNKAMQANEYIFPKYFFKQVITHSSKLKGTHL